MYRAFNRTRVPRANPNSCARRQCLEFEAVHGTPSTVARVHLCALARSVGQGRNRRGATRKDTLSRRVSARLDAAPAKPHGDRPPPRSPAQDVGAVWARLSPLVETLEDVAVLCSPADLASLAADGTLRPAIDAPTDDDATDAPGDAIDDGALATDKKVRDTRRGRALACSRVERMPRRVGNHTHTRTDEFRAAPPGQLSASNRNHFRNRNRRLRNRNRRFRNPWIINQINECIHAPEARLLEACELLKAATAARQAARKVGCPDATRRPRVVRLLRRGWWSRPMIRTRRARHLDQVYEDAIRRPYFHAKPLDDKQLQARRHFVFFVFFTFSRARPAERWPAARPPPLVWSFSSPAPVRWGSRCQRVCPALSPRSTGGVLTVRGVVFRARGAELARLPHLRGGRGRRHRRDRVDRASDRHGRDRGEGGRRRERRRDLA